MKTQVIIPTAGQGIRLESKTPKPLVVLDGKPLIYYTLKAFEECKLIDSVILVVSEDLIYAFEKIQKDFEFKKIKEIVIGGATRQKSVSNGLARVDDDTDIVLVHDGGRPLISCQLIEQVIGQCEHSPAVVVAVPVKPTIKRVHLDTLTVTETLNRDELWEVQTPQAFQKDILVKAHQQENSLSATDDAMLIELMGLEVKVIKGDYKNIKVTTQEDLLVAKAFLNEKE